MDALRPTDRLMVLSFDRRIYMQADLTNDHDRLRRAIFQLTKDRGTRVYDAIALTSPLQVPPRARHTAAAPAGPGGS